MDNTDSPTHEVGDGSQNFDVTSSTDAADASVTSRFSIRKKMRMRAKLLSKCVVCGERASGVYFGAVVCLPCKVRTPISYSILPPF